MAYRIDPTVRVFSIDTGRLPQETFDLVEQLRERYEGLRLELLSPDAGQVQRLVDRHGPNLFFRSVENRLLCCNVRKVQPLTRVARRPRRLGHRPAPRPVGLALRHPQGRDRPRPRRDREAEPARRVVGGRGLGLPARERRAHAMRSTSRATRRSAAALHATRSRKGEPVRAGRWWWETGAPKECGMHCAIETGGFEHELHAIVGEGSHE